MKKGYSLVEFLIGLLLSFFVLQLCVSGLKFIKLDYHDYTSQDLISSLQIHQILNASIEINVLEQELQFSYLDQDRRLHLTNNKIILKPGTNIYYLKVDSCNFYLDDDKIYLQIIRKNKTSKFLIGLL